LLNERDYALNTIIFYYTGTGNSLWAARTLADQLQAPQPVLLHTVKDMSAYRDAKAVGIVFPVHIWGVPAAVIRFVEMLKELHPEYVFAVAVNAGQVAGTLVQLEELLAAQGIKLSCGFSLVMPSNYIPWGGPGPREEQDKRFRAAEDKICLIANRVLAGLKMPLEKGPLWQRLLLSKVLYKISIHKVPVMDKSFWVDDKCNQCGICRRVCPADNITILDGRPSWKHSCEQCLACLQWCPQQAIQYGKETPNYERYHHPQVELRDMLTGQD